MRIPESVRAEIEMLAKAIGAEWLRASNQDPGRYGSPNTYLEEIRTLVRSGQGGLALDRLRADYARLVWPCELPRWARDVRGLVDDQAGVPHSQR